MLDIALTAIFIYKTMFWLLVSNLIVFTIKQTIRRNFRTARIFGIFTILFYLIIGQVIQIKCASDYYSVFMNQSTKEDLLERPIKEAGYHIGPLLTNDISDKEMKYRRYAIMGLAEIDYKPAIPTLKDILFDKTEMYYFRADALQTLMSFSTTESKTAVIEFKNQATDDVDKEILQMVENLTSYKDKNGSH